MSQLQPRAWLKAQRDQGNVFAKASEKKAQKKAAERRYAPHHILSP